MTSDWRIRELEEEIKALRRELHWTVERWHLAREERDRARETAVHLEQQLEYVRQLRPDLAPASR